MFDVFTSKKRSEVMRAVRSRDTTPELIVRRLIWEMGFHYRLCVKSLPGSPDIVMKGRRKAIFVNGCFWHLHKCQRGARRPKTRRAYWDAKRLRNKARDTKSRRELHKLGWDVLVIWECQTRKADALASRIEKFLSRGG
jgi:DNA mismatch endonuclease (patch repair protein)